MRRELLEIAETQSTGALTGTTPGAPNDTQLRESNEIDPL